MKKYNTLTVKAVKAIAAVIAIIRALLTSAADIRTHISRKNKKLVPDENTAFIIWSLPAIFTCPNRTPLCEKYCYATKAEACYPEVLPARVENYLISRRDDFIDVMTAEIMKIAAGSRKKYIIVRIHESGDFYNMTYINKWLRIMKNCAADPRIKFIAYTKSFRFFDGLELPKNFSLRASVWDDTPEADLAIIRRNGWKIYTAVEKFERGSHYTPCPCKNCAGCKKCWHEYKDIRCLKH